MAHRKNLTDGNAQAPSGTHPSPSVPQQEPAACEERGTGDRCHSEKSNAPTARRLAKREDYAAY